MSSGLIPVQLHENCEPIPGYVIRERIGAGGYGEVWKADAPGGLTKAIKFVYGHLEDARASREFKSLNRIREVRHPFLLSLERIEVIDGHLIIVTELANESLKDRYERYRSAGDAGIPREELLVFLRDAADALDYINDNYSLQHLDVKPENLLLLGNRVKVADFGMLKDIQNTSASIMGGLTPVYAPPEVFDGRPSRFSDQYSLAIVYQHMLTGELPFDGRTTAQLATQHLHSAPILAALPRPDQLAVARALSKQPEKRFPGCRAFIEALISPVAAQPWPRPAAPSNPRVRKNSSGAPATDTVPLPGPFGKSQWATPPSPHAPTSGPIDTIPLSLGLSPAAQFGLRARPAPVVESLEPLELSAEVGPLAPAIFIGIGGTAGHALQRLRRRLRDRFGSAELPVFPLLLLDIDGTALNAATSGRSGTPLHERETVPMPLRRPKNYRTFSKDLLKWMSRRWLYNIPLSLQTEGLRPLGRLAFIEHAPKVTEAIRAAIKSALDPENVAATEMATGLSIGPAAPRVYLISSISGGTGSGMVLDVAYTVRKVLSDFELPADKILGILTHSTDRKASKRDLAVANAYAFLRELQYFHRPGNSYPGDPLLGLPAFGGKDLPFSTTYVVHLGNELNDAEFDNATDSLAEYLYLDATTRASEFFDKCRQPAPAAEESPEPATRLRTFGLCQLGGSNGDAPRAATEMLCKTLVYRWRGVATPFDSDQPIRISEPGNLVFAHDPLGGIIEATAKRLAGEYAESLHLKVDPMVERAHEVIRREMRADANDYLRDVVEQTVAHFEAQLPESRPARPVAHLLETLDSILGVADKDDGAAQPFESLQVVLDMHFSRAMVERGTAVRNWILNLVDDPQARVNGAQFAADWLAEHLEELETSAAEGTQHFKEELANLREKLLLAESGADAKARMRALVGLVAKRKIDPRLQEYFRLRLHQVALRSVGKTFRLLHGQVTAASDQLKELWRDLNRLGEEFHVPADLMTIGFDAAPEPAKEREIATMRLLWARRADLSLQIDQELEARFFNAEDRLRQLLTKRSDARTNLAETLRAAARAVVLRAMKEINVEQINGWPAKSQSAPAELPVRELLDQAQPRLLACGGAKRLLMALPEGVPAGPLKDVLAREAQEQSTAVTRSDADAVLCYEVERLSLADVAEHLIDHRSDFREIAARLHTRIDIDWNLA